MLKLNQKKVRTLCTENLSVLRYPAEIKMFCRDCQNTLVNVMSKYRALEKSCANFTLLLSESRQEAKSWEEVYMDLTAVVTERNEVVELLRNESPKCA